MGFKIRGERGKAVPDVRLPLISGLQLLAWLLLSSPLVIPSGFETSRRGVTLSVTLPVQEGIAAVGSKHPERAGSSSSS